MSDNPADSLRRELRDALAADCQSVPCVDPVHWADADRVLPIVEAARADEREKIGKAKFCSRCGASRLNVERYGHADGCAFAAVSAGVEPKEQQT